jgi:predicted GTPase
LEFLKEKANSVKKRIKDATGVTVEPVCYSAGYMNDCGKQHRPYNLSKLLYYILMAVPSEKRLILADKLNVSEINWTRNDGDYSDAVKKSFWESLLKSVLHGVKNGAFIGSWTIGVPGTIVGGLVGGIVGGLRSLIVKPLSKIKLLPKLDVLSKIVKRL